MFIKQNRLIFFLIIVLSFTALYSQNPQFVNTADTLDFGAVDAGSSSFLYDTVSNTGAAVLEIWRYSFSGAGNGFVSTLYSTHQSINPGYQKTITYGFYPDEYRSYFDSLVIETNDPTHQYQTVYLKGSGVGRHIFLHETLHDFGKVLVSESDTAYLWVENNGNAVLTVDSIITSSSVFVIDSTNFTVDTSTFVGIPLYFTPVSETTYLDTFYIYSDATNDPVKIYMAAGKGIASHITLTDTVINFGAVNVFDSLVVRLPVYSSGTTNLTVTSYSVTDTGTFRLSDSSEVINKGDTSSVYITFAPDSLKTYSDTLIIYSNAMEGTRRIILEGTGGLPQISSSADSINFSNVTLYSTSSYKLVITNSNSGSLEISSVSADSSVYTFESYTGTVAGGDTSIIYVHFTPWNLYAYPDTIRISSNDTSTSVLKIPVNGMGAGSLINFSGITFDFDTLQIGTDSTISFYIKNTGNETLDISSVSIPNGYSTNLTIGASIDSGDSSYFEITFLPNDKGLYQGELIIESDDPASPVDTLTLEGYCLEAEMVLSHTGITFGNTALGNTDSVYLRIENPGNDSLRLALEVMNSNIFASGVSDFTVAPSDTDSVKISFTPLLNFGYYDTLKVISNTYPDTLTYIEVVGNPDSNFVPFFIGKPDTIAVEDQQYSSSFNVNNRDGDDLIFRFLSAPSTVGIDSVSGQITWMPAESDTGFNSFSVEVDDNKGGADTLNYTLYVQWQNDAPVITSTPPDTAYLGILMSHIPVVTDEENHNLTFLLEAFPSGMTISSTTGEIQWTPGQVQENVLVIFKVSDGYGGEVSQTFYIDVIKYNFPPHFTSIPDTTAVEDSLYTFTFTASDTNNDEIEFSIITAPSGAVIDPSSGVLSWTPLNENVGSNQFKIKVTDEYDASDTTEFYIFVSNTNDPPVLEDEYDYNGYVDSLFSITIDAEDVDPADTLYYYENSSLFEIDSMTGHISFMPTVNDTGDYIFQIWVNDGEFADTALLNLSIRFSNLSPVLYSIPDTVIYEASTFNYIVNAYDPDTSGILQYYDNTDLFDIDSATGVINFVPADSSVGVFNIEILVFDGYDYASQSFSLTILNVNQAPVILSIPDTVINENISFEYFVYAIDPDVSDTLYYYDNTELFDITVDSGRIEFTPERADTGQHNIEIYVSDGEYYDTTAFILTINAVNQAPEFVSVPDTIGVKGILYKYQVEADDIDGDAVWFYLETAPPGMEIDSTSGLVEWTPGFGQTGTHEVKIKADDKNGGTSFQGFRIIILDMNYPPVINSTPDTAAVEDIPYVYYIDAEDPEGFELSYSLENPPAGMTVNADSNALYWTPSNDYTGNNLIKLIVFDITGDSTVQEFNIYVENVNDYPSWDFIGDTSIIINNILYIDIFDKINDPDNGFNELNFTVYGTENLEGFFRDSSIVIYSVNSEYEGTDSVMVISEDPGGLADSIIIRINVIKPSAVPLFLNETLYISTKEDQSKTLSYKDWVIDADNSLDELDFLFLNEDIIIFTISDSVNRILTANPVKHMNGMDTVTVIVSDPDEHSDTMSIIVSISPVEDLPEITFLTPSGDTTLIEGNILNFVCSAFDADGDTLTFNWFVNGILVSEDTAFTYTAHIDTSTVKDIVLSISDSKNSIERTWQVTVSPVSGITDETGIPDKFAVSQNYPNPFNSETSFKVWIPEKNNLTITIYNILGQKVRKIYDGYINNGVHKFRWDSKNDKDFDVSSGIYIIRVNYKTFLEFKKLTLIK